ncbi:CaiB/BaiF CoA-transferase family protein [Nereida sp. MMG025]|uniref:CaiB/BaiF CoA transferase family protein n=1 Tax=Nereida sp. MMG025 TaxID=2909981 RepID=UPI001F1686D2|nr:CoA transferase [Nereida sp. MMG025]MCF6444946.1 CoA transferase [Nereida sp. MMG025]
MAGALDGLVVLDLSRILAGPTATQMLGDLGAKVIKIENPKTKGDDTRTWGPPFVEGKPDLSTYFLSANRNKLSVAIDITTPEGQAQLKALAAQADILVENYKVGGLAKYGLDHASLCAAHPALIYCSITGFGQTGPNANKPGYDLMAQGFGGIMSITGAEGGEPMKVGVAVADVVCGLYASVGILAALHHRTETGQGQHIDVGLVDTQMAWLINQATGYLQTQNVPVRKGNAHPNIVPYQVFEARDGYVILAVGNDSQFRRCVAWLGAQGLADSPDYATNSARLANRDTLVTTLSALFKTHTVGAIITGLEGVGVPVGPVNTLEDALTSDQAKAREMVIDMDGLKLLGNPLKLSRTPVSYRSPPPRFGQDTDEVLDGLDPI